MSSSIAFSFRSSCQPPELMRQADIFQDSEVWQQAVSLQDIADFLRAHLCQLLVGKAYQLLLFQLDTSLIRVGDAADQVEQGCSSHNRTGR